MVPHLLRTVALDYLMSAASAVVPDYHDVATGVLASSLAKRPRLHQLGFPDPRRLVR